MTYIPHKPGDPMPCHESTKILVKISNGMETTTPIKAKQWLWSECGIASVVGWQYAEKSAAVKTGKTIN